MDIQSTALWMVLNASTYQLLSILDRQHRFMILYMKLSILDVVECPGSAAVMYVGCPNSAAALNDVYGSAFCMALNTEKLLLGCRSGSKDHVNNSKY